MTRPPLEALVLKTVVNTHTVVVCECGLCLNSFEGRNSTEFTAMY